MTLLEREHELRTLAAALDKASQGQGQLVIVCGEAGIGKTRLIDEFVRAQRQPLRFLRGACDPFSIPHPLCPLIDIARQIPDEELIQMLWEPSRPIIFHACMQKLQTAAQPSVVVFEDIHWADEATYDLMIYLGRRVQQTNCLMIVTFRDDALPLDHPIRAVVGRLSGSHMQRLNLKRLSRDAVDSLAQGAQLHGEELFQLTGGNPFFVTELLTGKSGRLPETVSESVVARFIQQPPEVRKILEFAAIIPKKTCPFWLLQAVWDLPMELYERCAGGGLVDVDDAGLLFHHALARQAIAESLPAIRLKMLHMLALEGLIQCHQRGINVGLTHVVYHAQLVGDIPAIIEYAPMAAREAINLGAHQQAATHYQLMLQHQERLEPAELAETHDALAYECYLIGQLDEARQNGEAALLIWRQLSQLPNEAIALRRLSRFHWFLGDKSAAEAYAEQALAVARDLPGSIELAQAYSNRSQLHMLQSENGPAIAFGQKALAIGQRLGSAEVMSHALNNIGTAEWASGDPQGISTLLQSLQLAVDHRLEEHVARAYTNISSLAVRNRQYELAMPYFDAGLAYCERQGLHSWDKYMRGWLARCRFEQGEWLDAREQVSRILESGEASALIRQPALLARATIAVRQGDPPAQQFLADAWSVALETQESARLVPTAAIRAEAAWLDDALPAAVAELTDQYQIALAHQDPWEIGVIAFWLWKAGALEAAPAVIAEPYRLQIQGDWRAAAALWAELGVPYEQAMALSGGDSRAQAEALAIFDALGAAPAARLLRQEMRAGGIRGPQPETRANPAGLTSRQMQVLASLVGGMSDAQIAAALSISPKTAGHHVSAVIAKLGVRTRHQAAALALEQSWALPPSSAGSGVPH